MSSFVRTTTAMRAAAVAVAVLALATVAPVAASASSGHHAATTVPLPNSMASTGDSITRAFDIGWCCVLSDSPQYSWSTGTNSTVTSQYLRILAANRGISGHGYNDAKTGAKMADLDGQVTTAAGQGVQYLTILMGANDVCTSSASTMTPTATFKSEFQQALTDFTNADPTASIFVSSIPDIYQLWSTLHTNAWARAAWSNYGICQSMLSANNTEADRQAVAAQEQADNQALADVCALFTQCKWDGLATYDFKFPSGDVSTVDYFHPNTAGQNALAATTWAAGYWPATK